MEINKIDYQLKTTNFLSENIDREFIVLGNTFNVGMNHFKGWEIREGGKFTNTANYTITKDGKIHEHFAPNIGFVSSTSTKHDSKSILILFENLGPLVNGSNIFSIKQSGDNDNFEKRWKYFESWDRYTEEQYKSLNFLLQQLIENFNIMPIKVENNQLIPNISTFKGIYSRSNFNSGYYDVSPNFNFKKIEI